MAKSNSIFTFHLKRIVTNQFGTFSDNSPFDKELNISAGLTFSTTAQLKIISCAFQYQMLAADHPYILLEITCEFGIRESSWTQLTNSGKLVLPVGFEKHIGVITTGTTRVVLHAKTESTLFNQYPMPLINIHQILKEDIIFEI